MKLLKKILCGILSATMLITSAAIPVMADEDIKVTLDGKALSFDVPPQIINDRTMVPLRAIFEALGASVDWNQETKTVTSTTGDTTIKLTIDSNTMYVNNSTVTLDTPACVVNDRTLVPVRAISEAYNTNVDWNGDTKTVIISSLNNSSNNTTFNSPSPLNFAKLMWKIVDNGAYMAEQNTYGILEQLTDTSDICLLCKMEDNDKKLPESISLILTTENPDNTTQTTVILHETEEPTATITLESKYGKQGLSGKFSTSDGKFYKTDGNVPNTSEQDAINLLNLSLSVIDTYLANKEYITLENFNISYTDESNSSAPSATQQPTAEPQSKLPLLNHEYGPMTLNNYSSGKYWYSNNISSLVFTKRETTRIGKYQLYLSMQGITDHDIANVKVYFYDNNNRVLGEEWFTHNVTPNVEYNVLIDKYVDNNVIDNAVKVEFYSYTGEAAITGQSDTNTEQSSNNISNKVSDKYSNVIRDMSIIEFDNSMSGYDNLKNAIIKKGKRSKNDDGYTIPYVDGNMMYNFLYNEDEEYISILVKKERSGSTTAILTLKEDENPDIIFQEVYSNGKSYMYTGEYINSALVKTGGTSDIFSPESSIATYMSYAQGELRNLGINITMADLGVSTD